MPQYQAPLRDMQFVLHELLQSASVLAQMPYYQDFDADTLNAVLDEGARFAQDVVFPLNQVGDRIGCQWDRDQHTVKTPTGFAAAYQQYVQAGWPSLSGDPDYGGQGLPMVLNQAWYEMLNSANQAWTMYPGLTHGAYECLYAHGTAEQKKIFLPKLVSGEWTGTMCLTEPHCGTDLGLLRTQAVMQADGSYQITGSKIFISSGEHDMAENIVHLVLARLPDAPAGSKGISLFVVPKWNVLTDGTLGERNGIFCTGLEHKMGIHGNATCQMTLEGARGTMVGEPHKGLAAMFVMMNAARLGVGIQSLGLTEVAYQNAAAYAKQRRQMRSLKGPQEPQEAADCILVHADVRRMLLTARAYAEGGRAMALHVALLLDVEQHHPDAAMRQAAADEVSLLTPIIKAFLTENGWRATSECLQVFGGHGYIAEWGVEQFVRDARINMIYEGTNTIQGLDLLGRKVLADRGKKIKALGKKIQAFIEDQGVRKEMQRFINPLEALTRQLTPLTTQLGLKAFANADEVGAAGSDYLRLCGHWIMGWMFARIAAVALAQKGKDEAFYSSKLQVAEFYFEKLFPETATLQATLQSGAATLMAMPAERF